MPLRVASTEGLDRRSLLRIASTWYTALKAKPPAEYAMGGVYGLAVHERATTLDRFDATRAAKPQCVRRDAATFERAVEPDVLDAAVKALSGDACRDRWVSDDHHGVDRPVDDSDAWIAVAPLNLRSVRVDRYDFMSRLGESAEDRVRGRVPCARDAGDCDSLGLEEGRHWFGDGRHGGNTRSAI